MKEPLPAEPWNARVRIRDEISGPWRCSNSLELPCIESLSLASSGTAPGCEVVRSSKPNLAKFCTLSSTAAILLFTPAVIPYDQTPPQFMSNKDPFELLGRALSEHHQRIRHVPYVPRVGFTDTHGVFLAQCDTVIVVTCESSVEAEDGLFKQANFVEDVVDFLGDAALVASHMPKSLLQFGTDKPRIDLHTFDNVLQSDHYNKNTAQQIMQLLFDPCVDKPRLQPGYHEL